MKSIKEYYRKHKDSIKNATIGGLITALAFSLVALNAADKILTDNGLIK